MGWRNIWRNQRRTAITVGAMAFSVVLLIFFAAFMASWVDQMEENVVGLSVGSLQIHHPRYLSDQNLYQLVERASERLARLDEEDYPAAPRNFGYGLLAADETGKSAGVQLRAIDLEREPRVTDLHEASNLFAGQYLDGSTRVEKPARESAPEESLYEDPLGDSGISWQSFELTVGQVVLGRKLAKNLGVGPGSTVNVVVMAADGTLGNELFDVVGVFKNFSEIEDRTLTLVTLEDYERLFHLPDDEVHEIAVRLSESQDLDGAVAEIQTLLGDDVAVTSWREILPAVAEMVDVQQAMLVIFSFTMFLGAGLLIMNSMLMMVFERIREFGVMKALGLKGWQLLFLVFFETFFLAILSALVGLAVGIPLTLWIGRVGIDLSRVAPDGLAISGTVLDPVMTTQLTPFALLMPLVTLFVVAFVAVIYPAVKAALIEPLKALYHL